MIDLNNTGRQTVLQELLNMSTLLACLSDC